MKIFEKNCDLREKFEFRKMKFLLPVILVGIFEEKIDAKKIERNSGWASTSVLDIVEVQSKYFIKFPWYQIPYQDIFLA